MNVYGIFTCQLSCQHKEVDEKWVKDENNKGEWKNQIDWTKSLAGIVKSWQSAILNNPRGL